MFFTGEDCRFLHPLSLIPHVRKALHLHEMERFFVPISNPWDVYRSTFCLVEERCLSWRPFCLSVFRVAVLCAIGMEKCWSCLSCGLFCLLGIKWLSCGSNCLVQNGGMCNGGINGENGRICLSCRRKWKRPPRCLTWRPFCLGNLCLDYWRSDLKESCEGVYNGACLFNAGICLSWRWIRLFFGHFKQKVFAR